MWTRGRFSCLHAYMRGSKLAPKSTGEKEVSVGGWGELFCPVDSLRHYKDNVKYFFLLVYQNHVTRR